MGHGVVKRIWLIGNVPPQARAVYDALHKDWNSVLWVEDHALLKGEWPPDLIVVAGYRRLVPPDLLAVAPTVGFHSAKLPEYPGRAPIPWTLLRGDSHAYNTLLYLDEGVDSGDIIDQESYRIQPGDTPADLYEWVAQSDVRLLRRHLAGLLAGNAPRTPQDPAKRGPLTTADGWKRHAAMPRYTP